MKTTTQKFKHLIVTAAAVMVSFLSLTSLAADATLTWTGGGAKTDDGWYIFEDKNNWSPATAISLTSSSKYTLTFPEQDSDEEIRILMPEKAKGSTTYAGTHESGVSRTGVNLKGKWTIGGSTAGKYANYRFYCAEYDRGFEVVDGIELMGNANVTMSNFEFWNNNQYTRIAATASLTLDHVFFWMDSSSNFDNYMYGSILLENGSALTIAGNFYTPSTGFGTISASGGSTMTFKKTVTLSAGNFLADASTVNFASYTITLATNNSFSNGSVVTFPSAAILKAGSSLSISGGSEVTVTGAITLNANCALSIDSSELKFANTFTTGGTGCSISLSGTNPKLTQTAAKEFKLTNKPTVALEGENPTMTILGNASYVTGALTLAGTRPSVYFLYTSVPSVKFTDDSSISISGEYPRFYSAKGVNANSGKKIALNFDIPKNGYRNADGTPWIPIVDGYNGKTWPYNDGNFNCNVLSTSAVYASDFDGNIPLFAILTSGFVRWISEGAFNIVTVPEHPEGTEFAWLDAKGTVTIDTTAAPYGATIDALTEEPHAPLTGDQNKTTAGYKPNVVYAYIKGVPPPPEYDAPTFTTPAVTGGKGKMTATTTVTLDPNVDMSVATASITFRYRPAASQDDLDWRTVTQDLTEDCPVTVELPVPGLADETDYTVEVTAKHVIGGTTYETVDPVTVTPVTVQPAALAPTFDDSALTLTGGADGASFVVEVAVAAFDEAFDASAGDTATAYMRYRVKDSGAEWTESVESPIDATSMKAELSAAVTKVTEDTIYEVQVWTKHVIGGYTYVSKTPATGEVTVSKPADTLPGFGDPAIAPKEGGVTATAVTMTVNVENLGDGANSATVKLMIRENGATGEGEVAAFLNIAAEGPVELTATGLEPGGTYELWAVVVNDEEQSIECGKITVTTAPAAPTFGDPALTVTAAGLNSVSVSAAIAALGAKSVPCDVTLYVRTSGETGDGTQAESKQVTIAGAVALTATGLDEDTVYEVRVVAKHSATGFEDAVATTDWVSFMTDATPPAFGAFAPDGAAGDTLAVTGTMASAGTVLVQVSTAEDFASVYAEKTAGFVATGATFAQSFHAEKDAPGYIAPGATYYVRLVATKGTHTVTSAVKSVTTAAASGVEVTNFTHANGTVTITGRVEPLGAGTSTVHILWCSDGMTFSNDETITVSAATGPDWTYTKTDYTDTFCYRIYVENSCPTASWETTPVMGPGSETPPDSTDTYYWIADGDEWSGGWEDPAHWQACDSSGNPVTGYHADYPDQKEYKKFSFSRIPAGSDVTVNLPAREVLWGSMTEMPGRANASLTFKGTPNKTVITLASASGIRDMKDAGERLVLDGLSITFPSDLRMQNVNQTLEIRNKAYVSFTAVNQSLHLQQSSTSGLGSTLIVDDATLDMTHGPSGSGSSNAIFLSEGGAQTTPVKMIIRGKNPQLLLSGIVNRSNGNSGVCRQQQIIFEVPEGGFADTPIKGNGNNKFTWRAGNASYYGIEILVDRDSPILQQKLPVKSVTYDLIAWTGGIDTDKVILDGGKVRKNRLMCHYEADTDPLKIQVDISQAPTPGMMIVIRGPTPQ